MKMNDDKTFLSVKWLKRIVKPFSFGNDDFVKGYNKAVRDIHKSIDRKVKKEKKNQSKDSSFGVW